MPTHVRFRLNKITGEVEEFLVDDQNHSLSEAEHDRIATEVARVITRRPLIHEVAETVPDASVEETEETEKDRNDDRSPIKGES